MISYTAPSAPLKSLHLLIDLTLLSLPLSSRAHSPRNTPATIPRQPLPNLTQQQRASQSLHLILPCNRCRRRTNERLARPQTRNLRHHAFPSFIIQDDVSPQHGVPGGRSEAVDEGYRRKIDETVIDSRFLG